MNLGGHLTTGEEPMAMHKTGHLSLIHGGKAGRRVDFTCNICEGDDKVISCLSDLLGKDPSVLINEAISGLIRKYSAGGDNGKPRLTPIKP